MKRLRVIFFGAKGVGKTSLLTTMVEQRFVRVQPTVGVDYNIVVCEGTRFLCWDVSGDPAFKRIGEAFIEECSVFVYVFDLKNEYTLDEALACYGRVSAKAGVCSHLLIGNFSDMGRLTETMSEKLDHYPELLYFESCAANVESVERMWRGIASGTSHLIAPVQPAVPRQRAQCCTLQ